MDPNFGSQNGFAQKGSFVPFAVVVTFQIKPGHLEPFLVLMRANAQSSLTQEPGCRQFDVATDPDSPGEVFLYEVYDDAAAFQVHLDSDHFKRFDAAVVDMVAHKHVRTYGEVWQ